MNPSVGIWNNPPPPGTESFCEEDEHSSTSSKVCEGSHRKSKERDRYDSDYHSRHRRRSRSRSRSRHRKSRDRRHRSRSHDRRRRSRSHDRHRHRSRSHDRHHRRSSSSRRHRKSKNEGHHSHKYSRSRSRSRSRSHHSKHRTKLEETHPEVNTSIDEEDEEPGSKENAFKNDGSFLEMFKKMQEEQEKAADTAKEQQPADAVPSVSKRRGGRVLKTGMVQKVRPVDEPGIGQGFDAWSVYMNEVKRYKEACCDDDSKTRPLVK